MGIPNPLIIHGINEANLKRYTRYIEAHGGFLVEIEPRADQGKYYLCLPEKAELIEERCIRDEDNPDGAYSQIDIGFPDGGWLTWVRIKKIGTGEPHHRLIINTTEAPLE